MVGFVAYPTGNRRMREVKEYVPKAPPTPEEKIQYMENSFSHGTTLNQMGLLLKDYENFSYTPQWKNFAKKLYERMQEKQFKITTAEMDNFGSAAKNIIKAYETGSAEDVAQVPAIKKNLNEAIMFRSIERYGTTAGPMFYRKNMLTGGIKSGKKKTKKSKKSNKSNKSNKSKKFRKSKKSRK